MAYFHKKKNIKVGLALVLLATLLIAPLPAQAAFTQLAVVNGDGVRLRRTPYNGTILELMYKGEYIYLDDEVYDPNFPNWIYVKRVKTQTKGWMAWEYFVHQ